MKKNLSSYFSAGRFTRWPLRRMIAAGAVALAVVCGVIGAAAVPLGSMAAVAAPQSEAAAPTPAPTPDPAWTNVNWKTRLSPRATATPEPDVEVTMELSGKNQTLGVDLYIKTLDENGKTVEKALTGVELEVTVTCVSLTKLKDSANKYNAQQSKEGAIGKYDLDSKTGSLLLQKLNPGVYKVSVAAAEGYVMPAAAEVTVSEKVSYTKVNVTVEQETKETEKEGQQTARPGGSDAPAPSQTTVASSKQENKGTAYVKPADAAGQSQYFWSYSGGLYLYYANGEQSPFRAELEKDASGSREYLVKAEYDPAAAEALWAEKQAAASSLSAPASASGLSVRRSAGFLQLTGGVRKAAPLTGNSSLAPSENTVPGEEATPGPSEEATPEPSAEATAEPSPDPTATAEPSPDPTATPTPSPTPVPTATMPPAPAVTSYSLYQDGAAQSDNGTFRLPQPSEIVTGYTYTGWQVIDGAQYYYDPVTHKPLTGTQVLNGTTYLFNMDGKLSTQVQGIDVSKYQGSIDWKQVKASGVEYVIIRCAYRGYETGKIVEDPLFRQNLNGAKAAGLRVGIYFFSQAVSEQEAVEEASACLKLLNGASLNYPIYFDTEFSGGYPNGRADKLSKADRTAIAVAFCETVRNSGYKAGVYASENFFANQLSYATVSRYSIWNAHYGVSSSGIPCDMWQYTSKGAVPGIKGNVDMNLSYIG